MSRTETFMTAAVWLAAASGALAQPPPEPDQDPAGEGASDQMVEPAEAEAAPLPPPQQPQPQPRAVDPDPPPTSAGAEARVMPIVRDPPLDDEEDVEPTPVEEPREPIPFELTASFFSRLEVRHLYDQVGLADSDAVRYRARLGVVSDRLKVDENLGVALRFVPQASGMWELAGLTDAALGLHEGVVEIHGSDTFRLEAGRFEMAYGNHLVIGNVDWHPTGRSFDGTRLRIPMAPEDAWIDGFFTITREGSPIPAFGDGDTWFTGVYAALGPHLARKLALDLYALGLISPESTEPMTGAQIDASVRVTLGSRFAHRFGPIDVRAEGGVQLGDESSARSIFAWHGDAEVGLNVGSFRVGVEGLVASGDDPATADTDEGWDHLFPTAHKFLGFADIIGFGGGINGTGRSNLASGVLHLSWKAADALALSAHGHFFLRLQDVVIPDPMMVMPDRTVESGAAGSEVDVGATWTLGTGLTARAGYSLFLPVEEYYGTSDLVHFGELELAYRH